MPASYAHYRFGKQVLPGLPGDVRQCIQRFRRMYDMGLQGPDFFFYHNPFATNAVVELARKFHNQTGEEFFARVCAQADSEAAQAYLYGLLAHYCLDSLCHPFVNRMVAIEEAHHAALEAEFERHLMAKDKLPQPHTQNRGSRISLTRGECMTVAAFYPPATGANVSRSIRSMALCLKFLANPNREKTEKLFARVKPNLLNYLVPEEEREDYALMIAELQELFDQAAEKYPQLLSRLQQYRMTGQPLGDDFAGTF